jgi:toxin-antitoxin system PIN domain toxin
LLDANALIALTTGNHVHHERVTAWLAGVDRFAMCPYTQGGVVRQATRSGATMADTLAALKELADRDEHESWPDDLDYWDAAATLSRVQRGAVKMVPDAYLVGLAVRHGGVLATLDRALTTVHPDGTLLIPEIAPAAPPHAG